MAADGGVGGEDALTESRQLATQLEMLSTEMSNMKAAVAVSEADKVDQIESIERKCQQQLMSMQQIMKGMRLRKLVNINLSCFWL